VIFKMQNKQFEASAIFHRTCANPTMFFKISTADAKKDRVKIKGVGNQGLTCPIMWLRQTKRVGIMQWW
jgi:hypothetical protein